MQSIDEFFAEAAVLVDDKLDLLIPQEDTPPIKLHEAIRWSVFGGGKRFRPALVIAVGRTFGAPDNMLLRTAAAIEMIHTYSLIHDDLPSMDDDDMRRGRETGHKKFGEATAILAGDALQALAFQTIGEDGSLRFEIRSHLITAIAIAAGTPIGMVGGQQMDLEAEGRDVSIESLEAIHRRKTGALITASAVAGAIIGEANDDERKTISRYASDLGLMFQITDDIIDVSQTSEALGKTAGKDAASKKATYPAIHGLEDSLKQAGSLYSKIESDLEGLERECLILMDLARFVLGRTS